MLTEHIYYVLFLVFISYFILLMLYYLLLGAISFFHVRRRLFEEKEEDYAFLFEKRATVPVSIIIPAHNEEVWIENTIKSLLNLKYPEYEIIVVDDASTDRTVEILDNVLKLRAEDKTYSDIFDTGTIKRISVSERYPNVTVINQTGRRGKARAMNSGLRFAKYDYVCGMDADTIIEPDALLVIMANILRDPEKVIGAGSYFGLLNGFKIEEGKVIERSFSYNPLIAYQNLEYLRSFIGNRLSWSVFNAVPILSGGVSVWRRDMLYELGGFDPGFSSEDIEITFRAQDHKVKSKKEYRILSLPYYVGGTEGPSDVKSLILQRNRWQRVTHETIWEYRHMMCNPRYGWFGFLTFPYFVFYEVFGVFFEIISICAVTYGWLAGILHIGAFLGYLFLMLLVQTSTSLIVLGSFLREQQKVFRIKYVAYLIFLSFFEFFAYRWIISIAKIVGTVNYFRGIRTFEQYQRKTNP